MQLSEHNLQTIKQTFEYRAYKTKPIRPCRVKFMGEFVTTESGKTIWRRIGDAKSAINLHIYNKRDLFFEFLPHEKSSYDGRFLYIKSSTIKELMTYLEKEKILEYVEVSADHWV